MLNILDACREADRKRLQATAALATVSATIPVPETEEVEEVSVASWQGAAVATAAQFKHYAPNICPSCGEGSPKMEKATLQSGEEVFFCPHHFLVQLIPKDFKDA